MKQCIYEYAYAPHFLWEKIRSNPSLIHSHISREEIRRRRRDQNANDDDDSNNDDCKSSFVSSSSPFLSSSILRFFIF